MWAETRGSIRVRPGLKRLDESRRFGLAFWLELTSRLPPAIFDLSSFSFSVIVFLFFSRSYIVFHRRHLPPHPRRPPPPSRHPATPNSLQHKPRRPAAVSHRLARQWVVASVDRSTRYMALTLSGFGTAATGPDSRGSSGEIPDSFIWPRQDSLQCLSGG